MEWKDSANGPLEQLDFWNLDLSLRFIFKIWLLRVNLALSNWENMRVESMIGLLFWFVRLDFSTLCGASVAAFS